VPRFLIQNFGCRASQADGAALESQLALRGFAGAPDAAGAELVILNTCTVTAAADEDVRKTVRQVHRQNPEARILITGCYAQRAPEELAALPGVRWVVGNSHKTGIPDLIGDSFTRPETDYHGEIHVSDIYARQDFLAAPVDDAGGDRSRPNLKVQDGCGNRCSFCIIPSVRGRSRSASADDVVAQVTNLAARYPEVVLSGINLGRWGREQGVNLRLTALLRRLLDETEIQRIRLSSIEPMDWSEDLFALMAESTRFAKHVHAPLQSGSDTVLRRMRRKYRVRHYEDRIRLARRLMPDAAIGADVMTGFPGETDAEFEESRAFIESLPFTYLHVFTYSERPGTEAFAAADHVPIRTRRDRTAILRSLAARKNLTFRQSMVGRTLSVVTLSKPGASLSSNYIPVELATPRPPNVVVPVVVGSVAANGVSERGCFPVLA
jgi:threonylcarbamoyladenosine tRNA methylthiotransferase MtaB